jgi:hypothetical protein
MRIIFAVIATLLSWPSGTQAQDSNPIRYRVDENNRLFINGDSRRYVDDLNTYLRCAEIEDQTQECQDYRVRGTVNKVLVPNLRTGAAFDAYQVQYDKVRGEHPKNYPTDGRRKLFFFVDPKWPTQTHGGLVLCRWRVTSSGIPIDLASTSCSSAEHEVTLAMSDSGAKMSYSATAALTVEFSDGTQAQFASEVFVRDFMIVALGDSYTSGEGNPERNYTSTAPAQWLDYRCHRSLFSYPAITAAIPLHLSMPRVRVPRSRKAF